MLDDMKDKQAETALVRRGWSALQANDAPAALHCANELVRIYPRSAEGWLLQSELLVKLNRLSEALDKAELALRSDPSNNDLKLHKMKCLILMKRNREAKALADIVSAQPLSRASQLAQLGLMYERLSEYELSLTFYLKAAELEPKNANNAYSVGVLYRNFGDKVKAVEWLERSIELNPSDHGARFLLSDVAKANAQKNNVEELKAALMNHAKSPEARVHLYHAMAKELEDLDLFDESFEQLALGATLRRQHIKYDADGDINIMAEIARCYSHEIENVASKGGVSDAPIFIIGLPRTGTTLVERIINSHSQVASVGETNNFSSSMVGLCKKTLSEGAKKTSLVELSTNIDFSALGQSYIDATKPAGDRPYFIEKMPLNFLYAGLIHKALPNAKIIHLQRNPMDACYAIYKRLFADIYPFSYNLDELADYYMAYRGLMDHWNKVMPGVIHNVNYEDVVADQEGESRKLLAYCGLEWEDTCLDFHKNKEASTTASASQVRRKIYNSSVGRWRHYEEQLQPLYQRLKAGGIQLD